LDLYSRPTSSASCTDGGMYSPCLRADARLDNLALEEFQGKCFKKKKR
jgi:hypothetical protein